MCLLNQYVIDPHSHTPVSYTHLDVYKRQPFYVRLIFQESYTRHSVAHVYEYLHTLRILN